MKAYITILRPGNCLMSSIASLIGSFIILKSLSPVSVIAAITAFLITGTGNVINDYVDIEADKINRPKRALPSAKIKPATALAYSIILFLLGISLSAFTTIPALLIAIFNSFLLIVYATKLKNKMYIGNAVVSYLVGSTILFGSTAVLVNFEIPALLLPVLMMSISALSNFSREIVKSLEDIEGDKLAFIKRVVRSAKQKIFEKFGIENGRVKTRFSESLAKKAAALTLMLVIIISPLPYLLRLLGPGYLILLVPTNLAFLCSAALLTSRKRKYSKISKLIKIGMLLGLLAYIAGILW